MGWLGLKKRPGRDKDEEELLELEPQPAQPLTPVLNLLVPDIAGVTSFHLRQFFDADEAEEFVEALPSISGLHAFWGLHEPPPGHEEGSETGEAMVLIRAAESSDTVYVVSFVDLDSALSFARFEVKRGMSLGLLLIYWAEIVEVEAGENGIRLSPDVPPLPGYEARRSWTRSDVEPTVTPAPEALVSAPKPVPVAESAEVTVVVEEPSPAAIDEIEEEESRTPEQEMTWQAETSEDFEQEAEEEFEQFVAEQEELRAAEQPEAPAETPAEVEEPAPEPEPVAVEEPEPVAAGPEPEPVAVEEPEPVAAEPEPEPVVVEEPEPVAAEPESAAEPEVEARTQEEMDIEREAIAFLKASANGKKSAPAPETAAIEKIEVSINMPAASEAEPAADAEPAAPAAPEPEETQRPAVPVTAQVGAAHGEHESEEELAEDRVEEVEKILKVKRWDKRESPFKGFDSPPGRF